jgi:hypothetical protein
MKGFFIQMVEGLHVINKKGLSTEEGILGAAWCWGGAFKYKGKNSFECFRV